MASAPSAEDLEGWQLPPLPILPASELSQRLTASAFHDIRRLANILSRVNLDSRREDLLDYIRVNRSRFLKSYAIINWLSGSHGELVVNASRALAEARSQREQIDTVRERLTGIQRLIGVRTFALTIATAVYQSRRCPLDVVYLSPLCGRTTQPATNFKCSSSAACRCGISAANTIDVQQYTAVVS